MTAKSANSTITVRLDPETKSRLDLLARGTRRSLSFLASHAVAEYVNREAAIVEGVEAGLADWEAGRLVPHDQAMDELDRHLAEALAAKKAGAAKGGRRSS
jgi:predicted transcriptional regulator